MSTDIGNGMVNKYEAFLSVEPGTEEKERYQKEAEFLAFYDHLQFLGQFKEVAPDLVKGRTTISIPAFFALDRHETNPVNEAALNLLPTYSFQSAYGDTTETLVDVSGLSQSLAQPETVLQAARKGKAVKFVVANTLGLLNPEYRETFSFINNPFPNHIDDNKRRLYDIRSFVRGINQDLNEHVVGEVSDIATMVDEKGYSDFLDYLIDAKQVSSERVATIFAHDAPVVE